MSKGPQGRQEVILLVEDDASLRLAMTKALRASGYRVEAAAAGKEGLEMALSLRPDLILLDVMLPGMNGFEVCERLRDENPDVPILMVTAKGEEHDKVRGLSTGADDYIVKPFGMAELCARIDAALRRQRRAERAVEVLTVGVATIDFRAHRIEREGKPVEVTAQEMKLMRYLVRYEGSLLPRQRILDAVWGSDYFGTDRTVDNFINRLRAKIEPDPKNPRHLVTVRGAGYRFTRNATTGED